MRAALHTRARFAMRSEFAVTQVVREPLIAAIEPQRDDLVEQHRRPHVRIIGEPLTHVHLEPIERIHDRRRLATNTDLPLTAQIRAHRLAVMTNMTSDRRQRPTLHAQRVDLHICSLCDHQGRAPLTGRQVVATASLRGAPPLPVDPQEVGNISEQV